MIDITSSAALTCGWRTDTEPPGAAPSKCGKGATAETDSSLSENKLVCGIHARSARSRGATTTPLSGPDVRIGQIWQDTDPRGYGRHLKVVEVGDTHATVMQVDPRGTVVGKERRTRVRLDRFRSGPTGYRLVQDVEEAADA